MSEPGPDEPPINNDDVFTRYHDYRARILFEPLVAAMSAGIKKENGAAPLPPKSPAIESLTWAPKNTIIRKANGSDNWPLTWADDDRRRNREVNNGRRLEMTGAAVDDQVENMLVTGADLVGIVERLRCARWDQRR